MPTFARLTVLASVALATLGACGDDDTADSSAPSSRTEWCTLIGDVDTRFDEVDNSDADLATKQAGYREIRDRLERLEAGLDQVDDEARDDVAAALAFAGNIVNAFIGADDFDDAEERLQPIFAEVTTDELPGSEWILDNCDVDVNG